MTVERAQKILDKLYTDPFVVSEEDVDEAVSMSYRALEREQRLLDRLVVLRYKDNPTYEEKVEYEALSKIVWEEE